MASLRKLPDCLKLKNIFACIKAIARTIMILYIAFSMVKFDLILHVEIISEYSKPFASALTAYSNNHAERVRLSESLGPSNERAQRARKRMAQIDAYKKLIHLAEQDKIYARKNNLDPNKVPRADGDMLIYPTKNLNLPNRLILQIESNCDEGKPLTECIRDIEILSQDLADSMERLYEVTRTRLITLEVEESELRHQLEFNTAVVAQNFSGLLECLYILYLFVRSGPRKKHVALLFSILISHTMFILWMSWRLYVRWEDEEKAEFNIIEDMGIALAAMEQKWYGFLAIAILGRGVLTLRKAKKDKSNSEDPIKIFHYCLFGEKEKLRRILSKYREFININDQHEGNTAMHLAILGNHLHIVQLLLYTFKDGLDSDSKNDEGYNPLDLAIVRKHPNIANTLLRDRYANPRLSSLILAVETDQARIVRQLSQTLEILQADLVDLVEPLSRFCDQSIELKRKDIQKNHRVILQREVDKCKSLILLRLKNYYYR